MRSSNLTLSLHPHPQVDESARDSDSVHKFTSISPGGVTGRVGGPRRLSSAGMRVVALELLKRDEILFVETNLLQVGDASKVNHRRRSAHACTYT